MLEFLLIAIGILVVALLAGIGFLTSRGRRTARLDDDAAAGTTLTRPRPPAPPERSAPAPEAPAQQQPDTVQSEAPPTVVLPPAVPEPGLLLETPPPSAGRLVRLRSRLARSQSDLGRGLLTVLAREKLTEDDWEEIEETLLAADVGLAATTQIVDRLRTQSMVLATASGAQLRELLVDNLTAVLGPDLDRTLGTDRREGKPGVVLVVGVNGAGKTTTVGKLARVLVGDGKSVVLGAADTFRAAAADQLAVWAERSGSGLVRGAQGSDPASVAHDACDRALARQVDVLIVDTAGRLHTQTHLMRELEKVRGVIARKIAGAPHEVLLVLDATNGQNAIRQAEAFTQSIGCTGVILTKLDGTAKGGVVVAVRQTLKLPVKFVGIGEGIEDLQPFEPEVFVESLFS